MTPDDMDDTDLQSLMSYIEPPEGAEKLNAFLRVVTAAVGGRTDADLARRMEVPPSAIANWKRRGTVPADHRNWFRTDLLPLIAAESDQYRSMIDMGSVNAVIRLIADTDGNPFGVEKDSRFATALMFNALLAWAHFASDVLTIHGADGGFDSPVLSQLVREGLPDLKRFPLFARL